MIRLAKSLLGAAHEETLDFAVDAATALLNARRYSEVRSYCRAPMEALNNPNSERAIRLWACLGAAESSFDTAKGVALLEGVVRDARALVDDHGTVRMCQGFLDDARRRLAVEQERSRLLALAFLRWREI